MNLQELMKELRELCRRDSEFIAKSRFFHGNVRFGIGSEGFLVRFADGQFLGIDPDNMITQHWDYEIVGPEEDWAKLWTGEMDIMQAIMPEYSHITPRGDVVKFSADLGTITRLTRLLPLAAISLGVSARTNDSPPDGSPNPWQTKHEVLGRYVHINGVKTYYETIGKKGEVTFLAIHSAGRDCRQWQNIGDILGDVGELYAMDFPGHGKSWPLPGLRCFDTTDDIAFFVWSFKEAVGLKGPIVVIGCSIGGNLAFQIAADHPDEIVALVSHQGTAHSTSPTPAALLLMDHPRINPSYSHGEQSWALTGKHTPAPQRDYLNWDIKCLSSITLQSDLIAYSKFDFRDRMTDVRCPSLLIRGQDDFAVNADMVNEAAELLKNAPVVEVIMPEGVGHYSHVEQPVELGTIILSFLRRNGIVTSGQQML